VFEEEEELRESKISGNEQSYNDQKGECLKEFNMMKLPILIKRQHLLRAAAIFSRNLNATNEGYGKSGRDLARMSLFHSYNSQE